MMTEQPQQNEVLRLDLLPDKVGEYMRLIYRKEATERCLVYAQGMDERKRWNDDLVDISMALHALTERFIIDSIGLKRLREEIVVGTPQIDLFGNTLLITIGKQEKTEKENHKVEREGKEDED